MKQKISVVLLLAVCCAMNLIASTGCPGMGSTLIIVNQLSDGIIVRVFQDFRDFGQSTVDPNTMMEFPDFFDMAMAMDGSGWIFGEDFEIVVQVQDGNMTFLDPIFPTLNAGEDIIVTVSGQNVTFQVM